MKKIVIIIGVCSQIFLWGCGGNNEEKQFTFDDVKGKYAIEDTIDTPRAVIEVLKNKGKIDIVALEDVEGEANSNILITVTKEKDVWHLLVKTRTAIPSYSCEYSMNTKGEPIGSSYVVKKCSYNK